MDVQATVPALKLALRMIAQDQTQPPQVSFFQDVFPRAFEPAIISLEKDFPRRLTGIALAPEMSARYLTAARFSTAGAKGQLGGAGTFASGGHRLPAGPGRRNYPRPWL